MALPSLSRPPLLQTEPSPLVVRRRDDLNSSSTISTTTNDNDVGIDPLHQENHTPRLAADPGSTGQSPRTVLASAPVLYVASESQYTTVDTSVARKPLELPLVGSVDDGNYWEDMALTQVVTGHHLQPPSSSQSRASLPSLPLWPTSPLRVDDAPSWTPHHPHQHQQQQQHEQQPPVEQKSLQLLVSQDLAFGSSVGNVVDEMEHVKLIHLMLVHRQQTPSSPPSSQLLLLLLLLQLASQLGVYTGGRRLLLIQSSQPKGLGSRLSSSGLFPLIPIKREPVAAGRLLSKTFGSLNFPRNKKARSLPTPEASKDLVAVAVTSSSSTTTKRVIPIPTTPKKRRRVQSRVKQEVIPNPDSPTRPTTVTTIPFYPKQLTFTNQFPHSFPVTIHYTQKRPRKSRASGCWTCRLRKKTCPRDGPVCHTCARLNLPCDYLDQRPVYMDVPGARAEKLREIRQVTDHKKVKHLRVMPKASTV